MNDEELKALIEILAAHGFDCIESYDLVVTNAVDDVKRFNVNIRGHYK